MRIVFTTWGSLGDLHPYLALGVELTRRGHVVAVATLRAWEANVRRAGLGFHPIRPDVPSDEGAAREMVRRLLDAKEGPRYLFTRVFAPVMRETYEDTLAAVRAGDGADLLVTHQVPVSGPIVAEVTGVQWVSGVLLPMSFLSRYDPATPPQAPGLRRIAAFHPLLADALNGLGRLVTRSWAQPTRRLRTELGLPAGGSPLFEGQHSPALVLALFSRVLARKQPDFPPQTLITGFAFYDAADAHPPDPALEAFLAGGGPPIVFTLGSSAVWIAQDFYEVAVEAVRTIGARAVLLAGERAAALRASGLPESILAVDYAPHSLVMPHGAAIVHQGGVGTTGQALRAGRPQLIVPFGQDQPDNARRCTQLGVARMLPRPAFRRDRVAAELRALLDDPAYRRRAVDVGREVQGEDGVRVACDAIESRFQKAQGVPTDSWGPLDTLT